MENERIGIDEDYENSTDSDSGDSSGSSNFGIFNQQEHLVLELHDLKKDAPEARVRSAGRVRKHKKKRRKSDQSKSAASSSSNVSERQDISKVPVLPEQDKEEFFDAQGSFHGMEDKENRDKSPAPINVPLIIKVPPATEEMTSSNRAANPSQTSKDRNKSDNVPEQVSIGSKDAKVVKAKTNIQNVVVPPKEDLNVANATEISLQDSRVPYSSIIDDASSLPEIKPATTVLEVITSPAEFKTETATSDPLVTKAESELTKEVKRVEADSVTSQLTVITGTENKNSRQQSALRKPVQRPQ